MKKELTFALLLLGLSMMFPSCQKAPEPFFSMESPTYYEFNAQGGIQTLTFYTNQDWVIVGDDGSGRFPLLPSWIECSPHSGTGSEGPITVTIHCFPKTDYGNRSTECKLIVGNPKIYNGYYSYSLTTQEFQIQQDGPNRL